MNVEIQLLNGEREITNIYFFDTPLSSCELLKDKPGLIKLIMDLAEIEMQERPIELFSTTMERGILTLKVQVIGERDTSFFASQLWKNCHVYIPSQIAPREVALLQ